MKIGDKIVLTKEQIEHRMWRTPEGSLGYIKNGEFIEVVESKEDSGE